MTLGELLKGIIGASSLAKGDIEIKGLALDSRKVKTGFVFIAVAGSKEHGLSYATQAIEKGAVTVIYDPQGSEWFQPDVSWIKLADLSLKLGKLSARFYQLPSTKLDVIGITGTNGKTTCSQFLLQLIAECGVIGTLGWGTKEEIKKTANTTPDALAVQAMLDYFVETKKKTVVMEVSSHGCKQGRVNGVRFKGVVLTNLSRDHLDYHGTMQAYCEAKLLLFKYPRIQFCVVNADDGSSQCFLAVVDKGTKCWAYSANGKQIPRAENVYAEQKEYSLHGIKFLVCWRRQKIPVTTKIVGAFNLDNILAVITVLIAQGQMLGDIVKKVSDLKPIPGRMEVFGGVHKPYVLVDYAHTPDALKKVLKDIKRHCQGKLWVVFGCGGNRDKGKRSQMGVIASALADTVIITNDNPRFETAELIIKEILKDCMTDAIEVIQNREQAIRSVIHRASREDCIVIAGKGHEDYQDIKGKKQPFSDQKYVKQGLMEWAN